MIGVYFIFDCNIGLIIIGLGGFVGVYMIFVIYVCVIGVFVNVMIFV